MRIVKLTKPMKFVSTKMPLKFFWQGCNYTFDPETKMIGGYMEYHFEHAEPALKKYLRSIFPEAI